MAIVFQKTCVEDVLKMFAHDPSPEGRDIQRMMTWALEDQRMWYEARRLEDMAAFGACKDHLQTAGGLFARVLHLVRQRPRILKLARLPARATNAPSTCLGRVTFAVNGAASRRERLCGGARACAHLPAKTATRRRFGES